MNRPTVICLTPVRNESWILDRFLRCASLWADRIVVADQGSTDGSREIARSHPKVLLVDNPSADYDEAARQKLLIEAARHLPAPRLLIALDADEFLTADALGHPEWEAVLRASPGTVIRFQWANLLPGLEKCWIPENRFPWGFMDDGSPHQGSKTHSPRIPTPSGAPCLDVERIKVMHLQYADWHRMRSKHRWYQCLERLQNPDRSAVDIYRQYHHMDSVPASQFRPVPDLWTEAYRHAGIDLSLLPQSEICWWDLEVLRWLEQNGPRRFRREAVWDVDWRSLALKAGMEPPREKTADPRGLSERLFHAWLGATQPVCGRRPVRMFDAYLRKRGW